MAAGLSYEIDIPPISLIYSIQLSTNTATQKGLVFFAVGYGRFFDHYSSQKSV